MSFATAVLGITLMGAALPLQAAHLYVKTSAVRAFHIDSRRLDVVDGDDIAIDVGFIPPEGVQLYLLQPGLGRQHLYFFDLPAGTRKDVSKLIPDGCLSESLRWSPDGGHFAYANGTKLVVITTADGSTQSLDAGPDGLKPRQIYWADSGHLFGVCANAVCLANLDAGKVSAIAKPKSGTNLPELNGYFPASKSFLWEAWGPDTGSTVFFSTLQDVETPNFRAIPFPQMGGESSISATTDGIYVVTVTNIGNGDSPLALFMGNLKSGRWARLRDTKPWGDDFSAMISPTGNWIAIDVSSIGKQDVTRLYIAKVPRSLRDYLDGKHKP